MDDREQREIGIVRSYGQSPARLLLVRCWLERDGEARLVFRGQVHDPAIADADGRLLGSFDTFESFRSLLIQILDRHATEPIV